MTHSHDVAVYLGRFQPFHVGHLALLRKALDVAPLCVVVLGSSFQARTPKNPFTWQERAEMVRLSLGESERARVLFLPLRDYYNEPRWVAGVQHGVARLVAREHARVALVGHFKDATSDYLRQFPGWTVLSQDRQAPVDGTHLRDALFGAPPRELDGAMALIGTLVPPGVAAFIRAWTALPFFAPLTTEWQMLATSKREWASAPYPPVFVTVDAVVQCAGQVLLVERGRAPGKGLYAVPGGFIEQRETAYQSAVRELREETHIGLLEATLAMSLREVAVFDHPDRSLRGRTITHAHHFDLGDREPPEVRGGDDAASADWILIEHLVAMEDRFLDDHFHMLDHFLGLTQE